MVTLYLYPSLVDRRSHSHLILADIILEAKVTEPWQVSLSHCLADHVHLKELGNMGLAAQAQGATYLTAKLGHNGEVDSETAQLVREDIAH